MATAGPDPTIPTTPIPAVDPASVVAHLRDERDRLSAVGPPLGSAVGPPLGSAVGPPPGSAVGPRLGSAVGPPPGRAWCLEWTRVVDEAVAALWTTGPATAEVTVVAVGGYGRRELCPGSDVDVLVLHEGLEPGQLDAFARAVFHPLWDAGFKLGNAVRSTSQLVGDALDELDTATAVLDGRVVAGDPERFTAGRAVLLERLSARPRKFLTALAQADTERRRRAGDAAEQLEPDVKNGAGGLRDVQSLRWAAAALVGEVGIEALVTDGHVGATDAQRLHAAEDELLALRVALHLTTGTPVDVLRFEHQQEVAERIGEVDGVVTNGTRPVPDDADTAAHRALTRHFLAARTIEHVHDRAWRQIEAAIARPWRRWRPAVEQVHGLEVLDGAVRLPEDASPLEPGLPARVIRALLAGDHVLDRHTATRLRAAAADLEVSEPWDEDLRGAVRELLWSGNPIVRVTAELDDVGWLVALIPEWAPLRGRPQRNPFHRYSLDRHAVHAVAALGELVQHEPWAKEAHAEVLDTDVLALAVLLHDIGKAFGEPHSETGVPVARAVGERFGLGASELDSLGWLVRHHLLLPDIGTRRDVADPAEAHAVAELVGDRSRLASLWLLSAADGTATGPSAWTSWRASLVRILVTKVRAVLDERDPAALHDGAVATAEAAVELAPQLGVPPEQVRMHLAQLPERYAAAVSPRAVVRHASLTVPQPEPNEVRTRVTPGEPLQDGLGSDGLAFDELDVVALDSPGLFAKVAGVLSLHGASVLEAHAHTRADGTAVDTFTVVLPEHVTGSWWVTVEGDLVEAVAGRIAVRARVARKRSTEHRRLAKLPPVATTVSTSSDAAGRATVVEVHTLDRAGVLYRIASALAELELDLVVAKVGTFGHEAHDVFTVRDATGEPLDRDHCAELELAIRAALAE